MYAATPAASKSARIWPGSLPPGIDGALQSCGSPRKNCTAFALRAIASVSGSPSCRCGPTIGIPRAYPSASCSMGTVRLAEPAVRQAQAHPDEGGDDAAHDEHALGPGCRQHLGQQPDDEASDAEDAADEVVPAEHAEDEGRPTGDGRVGGSGIDQVVAHATGAPRAL